MGLEYLLRWVEIDSLYSFMWAKTEMVTIPTFSWRMFIIASIGNMTRKNTCQDGKW